MHGSLATVTIVGTVFVAVACGQSTSPNRSMLAPSAASSLLDVPVAPPQVPFKGRFEGSDTVSPGPSPGTFLLTTNATGTGTHLGQFSFTQELTINVVTPTGSARWIAANGDSISTSVVTSAIPDELVFTLMEVHTVTDGTGRFSGAQGTFTADRIHVRAPS